MNDFSTMVEKKFTRFHGFIQRCTNQKKTLEYILANGSSLILNMHDIFQFHDPITHHGCNVRNIMTRLRIGNEVIGTKNSGLMIMPRNPIYQDFYKVKHPHLGMR